MHLLSNTTCKLIDNTSAVPYFGVRVWGWGRGVAGQPLLRRKRERGLANEPTSGSSIQTTNEIAVMCHSYDPLRMVYITNAQAPLWSPTKASRAWGGEGEGHYVWGAYILSRVTRTSCDQLNESTAPRLTAMSSEKRYCCTAL